MKIAIPRVHGSSPKEKLIRSLALLLVLAAVVWAFYENNKRVVEMLNKDSAVYDETDTLDKDQRKFIVSFVRSLRSQYGLACKIQIFGGDFVPPEIDTKTMYIGLAPSLRQVVLIFPPMMRSALGAEFIESLKTEHFLPAFQEGDWPSAIEIVLVEIFNKLEELQNEEQAQ